MDTLNESVELRNVEDVVQLPTLTEAIILDVLQERYKHLNIYTNTGDILLAVNPFAQVGLYSNDILEKYRSASRTSLKNFPPHPWKTATKAYCQMFGDDRQMPFSHRASTGNMKFQSIIVSGESGAGKTETTKIVMSYLARASSWNKIEADDSIALGLIQRKVLQANPILDALGNARTVRNDNSSRFGKYIKLYFDSTGELKGAGLDTFLLETTRVVQQRNEERNFHIFYMLCAETNAVERARLKIRSAPSYSYLNTSGVFDRRDKVSDRHLCVKFRESLSILGVEPEDIDGMLRCAMAVLTLGDVRFKTHSSPSGDIVTVIEEKTRHALTDAAELLGIDAGDLFMKFTSKLMKVASEDLTVTLTSEQSEETRDIFAKTLYSALFAWTIECLNSKMLTVEQAEAPCDSSVMSCDSSGPSRAFHRSHTTVVLDQFGSRKTTDQAGYHLFGEKQNYGLIGILDIFGFEYNTDNGLEQLLINFANEHLQKQFDETIILAEQQLYMSEGIEWDFIEFPSTMDCIELIADKRASILTLLDEACIAPSGSDKSFANQVYNTLSKHNKLSLSAFNKSALEFGVIHYAGTVVYDTKGFVAQNKNRIFPLSTVLSTSSFAYVSQLGGSVADDNASASTSTSPTRSVHGRKSNRSRMSASIANSFKDSVAKLITTINGTEPHYIKCLKPNNENVQNKFIVERIWDQLLYSGVMQTISITRSGFPFRFTYEQFYDRYYSLMRALLTQEGIDEEGGAEEGKSHYISISAGIDAITLYLNEAFENGDVVHDGLGHEVSPIGSPLGRQRKLSVKPNSPTSATTTAESSLLPHLPSLGIQHGTTRIFLTYSGFLTLEKMHNTMAGQYVVTIQSSYRRYVCQAQFKKWRKAAARIIREYRLWHRRHKVAAATVMLQDFVRKNIRRIISRKQVASVIVSRCMLGMLRRYIFLRQKTAATVIQQWYRRPDIQEIISRRQLCVDLFGDIVVYLQRACRRTITRWKAEVEDAKRQRLVGNPLNETGSTFSRRRQGLWCVGSLPEEQAAPTLSNRDSRGEIVTCRTLFKANQAVLWPIFCFYCQNKALIPAQTMEIPKRNTARIVSTDGMLTLLKDWGVVPLLITAYKAAAIVKHPAIATGTTKSTLLSYAKFGTILKQVAGTIVYPAGPPPPLDTLHDKPKSSDDLPVLTDNGLLGWGLRCILTVMDRSGGRQKFLRSRSASVIPTFVGVEGSSATLQPASSSGAPPEGHERKSAAVNPHIRDIEMSADVCTLMKKNESTLVTMALRYCPQTKSAGPKQTQDDLATLPIDRGRNQRGTPPSAKKGTRRSMSVSRGGRSDSAPCKPSPSAARDTKKNAVKMPLDCVWALLMDFGVCPDLCSKAMLQKLYDHVARTGGAEVMERGLTYPLFVELLDHVAQNCVYTTKSVYGAVSRVRTMFHVMNSSRGRVKLAKGTNASIIPPLTGLDSTDPTFYKPAGVMPAKMARSPVMPKRSLSQSPVKPLSNTRRKPLDRKTASSAPTTPEYNPGLRNGTKSGSSTKRNGGFQHGGKLPVSRASSSSSRSSIGHRADGKPEWV